MMQRAVTVISAPPRVVMVKTTVLSFPFVIPMRSITMRVSKATGQFRATVHRWPITFVVEKTRADSYHACTVDDIAHLLEYIAPTDLEGIELIVLRQPKRKEEILNPLWGRVGYYVKIGKHRGRAIFIEAVNLTKPMRWSKSLIPDFEIELERLRKDGHQITTTKSSYRFFKFGIGSSNSTLSNTPA